MAKINGFTIKYDPIYKDFLLINKNNEIVSKHYTYGLAVKEAKKNKPLINFNKAFKKSNELCQSSSRENNFTKSNKKLKNDKKSLFNKINKNNNKEEEKIDNNKIKKLLNQFKE